MTKKNWKMQSETVQFAGLSQFVNEAFDDLGDFWSAFSDEIDVSYGDAKHTLVSKLLVIDVLISMVNSEKNNANESRTMCGQSDRAGFLVCGKSGQIAIKRCTDPCALWRLANIGIAST